MTSYKEDFRIIKGKMRALKTSDEIKSSIQQMEDLC